MNTEPATINPAMNGDCITDVRNTPTSHVGQEVTDITQSNADSSTKLAQVYHTLTSRVQGAQPQSPRLDPTRCLVDTGAAVSVLDSNHLTELYDGHLPPLKPSSSDSIKTVSGQSMPIRGIL